jgi:NAD(P)H-hydrate epimerase
VIPVLTPDQMAAVDRSAPEPVEVLVERAGWAVARAARRLLGGSYGRRIVVVAGRGNNGADGRVAARRLAGWGAAVAIVEVADLAGGARLPDADLVVDAAFGTGLSRPFAPPDPGRARVLAVDIPSGLSGLTGTGPAMAAAATVTFASYKPGLLIGEGPARSGRVELAGIGLDGLAAERAATWLADDGDLVRLPARGRQAHKWQTAVMVVGGSAAMNGAPLMVAHGAMRAGAGYALVGIPGGPPGGGLPPGEQVGVDLPDGDWVPAAAEAAGRAKALAVGPGLAARSRSEGGGTGPDTPVGRLLRATAAPAVVDADGITALGRVEAVRAAIDGRTGPVILTPHEGEYEKLTGHRPAEDRIADVRETARQTGAVVLLKGSTTVVAAPDGRVLLANAGRPNLATAGTGDTLTGVIAAFLARGVPALEAAALAAHTHGRAAGRGRPEGLVASDLPDLVSDFLSEHVPEQIP